jgi:hypothetical protein
MAGKSVICALCDRPQHIGDLCKLHYERFWRNGHFELKRPADWGKRSKHPLWERWKGLLKRPNGRAAQWGDFWQFVKDVSPVPEEKSSLIPIREGEPLGPTNFAWKAVWSDKHDRKTREGRAAYMREWNARNPGKSRQNRLRRYGLDHKSYEARLQEQGGICPICLNPPMAGTQLYVDHDHETLETRDLLCRECNVAIGKLGDDSKTVYRAYKYLVRWKR